MARINKIASNSGSGGSVPGAGARLITSDSTQLLTDKIIEIDTSGGTVVYQLLPYADWKGGKLEIHKVTDDSNTATTRAAAGQNINGYSEVVMSKRGCLTLRSNALS